MPRRAAFLLAFALLGGCATPPAPPAPAPAPLPPWPAMERVDVHEGVGPETTVLGRLQRVAVGPEDTFPDIARRFDVGYDELVAANPGVDPWIPGEGTLVLVPTAHVIPDAPRRGIVVNVAAMRLWWFGAPDEAGRQVVLTHPIGIGRVGWATPVGETKVVSKAQDPTWYPPASVRREHAEEGDPLPAVVPPGPDNPLGRHAVRLALPGYLIHGTNKPWGVGMRVSHGCIRLYPEDIETLFGRIVPGMPVALVDQPWLVGEQDGELVFEAHAVLEEAVADWTRGLEQLGERAGEAAVDWSKAAAVVREARGIPMPVGAAGPEEDAWFARAPVVENRSRGNYREAVVAEEAPGGAGAGAAP